MIQVIHRALNILELLAENPNKEYFLSDISDRLELNKATCANIIKTLTSRGYIKHEEQRKGYELGHMAYKLANLNYGTSYNLMSVKDKVDALRDAINENVIISTVSNGIRILVYEAPTNHELYVRTTYELPVYKASTGRVMLAYMDEAQVNSHINRFGLPDQKEWAGINSKNDLFAALKAIRESPCYVEVSKAHVASVSAPIIVNGKAVASLGVYLPDIRFSPDRREFIERKTQETAGDIQLKLQNNIL